MALLSDSDIPVSSGFKWLTFCLIMGRILLLLCKPGNFWLNARYCAFYCLHVGHCSIPRNILHLVGEGRTAFSLGLNILHYWDPTLLSILAHVPGRVRFSSPACRHRHYFKLTEASSGVGSNSAVSAFPHPVTPSQWQCGFQCPSGHQWGPLACLRSSPCMAFSGSLPQELSPSCPPWLSAPSRQAKASARLCLVPGCPLPTPQNPPPQGSACSCLSGTLSFVVWCSVSWKLLFPIFCPIF